MDNNELGTNLASLGTDCVSRQAAIDALNEYFDRIGKLKRRGLTKGEKAISLDTVGTIKTLPPAEPKRGKWERHYSRPNVLADLFWHCSECGYKDIENYAPVYHHFCTNCGADMRGEEHGLQ